MKFLSLAAAGIGCLLFPESTRACGPDFPNAYLGSSLEEITALPSLSFAGQLERMLPAAARRSHPSDDSGKGADLQAAEIAEVREALFAAGMPAGEIETAVAAYDRHQPSARLPEEFRLYSRGANAWIAGNSAEAVRSWRELLALPAKDRHYRTVWAAYMLGRALYVSDADSARGAFQLAREAGAHGFPDSQGLAVASLGWEARSYLVHASYRDALRLYFQQFQMGDPTALPSLQRTVRYAFLGEQGSIEGDRSAQDEVAASKKNGTYFSAPGCGDLWDLANDRQLRGIVTAWFVARGGRQATWGQEEEGQLRRWIGALHAAGDLSPDEADNWCWAAYQCGLWDDARRFAALARPEAPASEWVRAMLLLRDGYIDDAAGHLANAAKAFPRDFLVEPVDPRLEIVDSPWERFSGIQGVLALRRDQFANSLRLFLQAGHWADAAFVAERILTLDELTAFVRAEVPAPPEPAPPAADQETTAGRTATSARDLRYLLARRLVRADRFDQAREFFPGSVLEYYDRYVSDVRAGFDASQSAADRAMRFWAAAQIVRAHGMEILGTEMEPDFAICDGDFEWPGLAQTRYANVTYDRYRPEHYERRPDAPNAAILDPTDAEMRRAFSHLPSEQRFHYRHRSIELAWLAAELLPNDDDRTALILYTAGRWVAHTDAMQGDLFYKSLAVRCPHTELGRKAIAARWFDHKADSPPETN
jgi:hypothetical protein